MLENRAKFKEEEKNLFRELLDGALDSKNKYLAISTKMGINKSYIASFGKSRKCLGDKPFLSVYSNPSAVA